MLIGKQKYTLIEDKMIRISLLSFFFLLLHLPGFAQSGITDLDVENWTSSPGVVGTFALVLIVVFVAVLILAYRFSSLIRRMKSKQKKAEFEQVTEQIMELDEPAIDRILE